MGMANYSFGMSAGSARAGGGSGRSVAAHRDLEYLFGRHVDTLLLPTRSCLPPGLTAVRVVMSPTVKLPVGRGPPRSSNGGELTEPLSPVQMEFAAVRMTSRTKSGWDSMGTWLLSTS